MGNLVAAAGAVEVTLLPELNDLSGNVPLRPACLQVAKYISVLAGAHVEGIFRVNPTPRTSDVIISFCLLSLPSGLLL